MKTRLINANFKKDYVDSLLKARGIENPEDYYNPRREFLQTPTDLENVERGANLLMGVLALDEKIYLFLALFRGNSRILGRIIIWF